MIHSLGVVPAPACFLTRTWFVCLQSLKRSPFQEVTLAPQLLAFPKAFGKDFPRFALRCTEAPRVYSALARYCAQPSPLLMQALHTSRCDSGTPLQQWLGAQTSSKTPPDIDALPLGSLNPAPVPDPICLVVGRQAALREGAWASLSAHPRCNGMWGGWKGQGRAQGPVTAQESRSGAMVVAVP